MNSKELLRLAPDHHMTYIVSEIRPSLGGGVGGVTLPVKTSCRQMKDFVDDFYIFRQINRPPQVKHISGNLLTKCLLLPSKTIHTLQRLRDGPGNERRDVTILLQRLMQLHHNLRF